MSDENALTEAACEVMHDAYEAAAAAEGWETQERSRKPWADVPDANKATMRVAVSALLEWLAARAPATDADLRDRVTALADVIHGDSGWEHNSGCEGEPDCFACIVLNLRQIAASPAPASEGRHRIVSLPVDDVLMALSYAGSDLAKQLDLAPAWKAAHDRVLTAIYGDARPPAPASRPEEGDDR